MFLHGLLKSATFFCVGGFVKFYKSQDVRLWGVGNSLLKLESFVLFLCFLNIFCFPASFGFFLKEILLTGFFLNFYNTFDVGCIFIVVVSSSFYSIKLFYFIIFNWFQNVYKSYFDLLNNTVIVLFKWFFCKLNYYFSIIILLYFGFTGLVLYLYMCECNEFNILLWYGIELDNYIVLIKLSFFYINYYCFLYIGYLMFIIFCYIFILLTRFYRVRSFYYLLYLILLFLLIK
jgi:hypothetical protein